MRKTHRDRSLESDYRDLHHPEHAIQHLLAKRQCMTAMQASFLCDVKTGAVTGPRLKGRGLLRVSHSSPILLLLCVGMRPPPSCPCTQDLPAPDVERENKLDDHDPLRGPPPNPNHLIKFEPLPSTPMNLARAVLCSAAAGPASCRSVATSAESTTGLTALLCAEPIKGRTRMWAAYSSRAAAEGGMRAINALPQMAELLDSPPAQRDAIMPARELPPPPLSKEELAEHTARGDELIAALAGRLGLPGPAFNDQSIFAALTASECLEARLLYLRRVHYFDALGGGSFASHTSLLATCGEAHLPSGVVIHATHRDLVCMGRTRCSALRGLL